MKSQASQMPFANRPNPASVPSAAAWLAIAILLLLSPLAGAGDPVYEQQIELRPGWNAIHLEVRPEQPRVEHVFSGIPIASVWRWIPDDRTVDFIRDPNEELLTIDGWYGYFPPERPESILTNLYVMHANEAYLVRLQGSQPVTLTVRGKPVLARQRWRTNDFQFTGFHVDPDLEPTFGTWFSESEAHQAQPIYRLNSSGEWEIVTNPHLTPIRSGEAYWVYTDGRSRFQGPMAVESEFGERVDFGSEASRDGFVIRNHSGISASIQLKRKDSDIPVPLAIETRDPENNERFWPVLPDNANIVLGAGEARTVTLGVRRQALLADHAEHIIEISNGLGARRMVSVSARAVHIVGSELQLASSTQPGGRESRQISTGFAGLWVGVASVEAVSQAQQGGVVPLPTGRDFPLRVLMHVDASGTVRLLKEVIQMFEEGTEVPDTDNPEYMTTETPGRFVLLTDDSLIPNYSGAFVRDGTPVGVRLSTAAFDFPGTDMELAGTFSAQGSLSGTIVLEPEFPTNPYLHRYHPDHNNLDDNFLGFREDAYEVTRELQFIFAGADPENFDPPEWGDSIMGGTYLETISGIHRSTIFVSGTFELRRVSPVPVLNQ